MKTYAKRNMNIGHSSILLPLIRIFLNFNFKDVEIFWMISYLVEEVLNDQFLIKEKMMRTIS